MKKRLLVFWLLLLKQLLGKRMMKLKIRNGINKGYVWLFGKQSNNEVILGIWESVMQDIFKRYLKRGSIIYDLGAHQGFLTLVASRLVGPGGKVYSFEALPSNFKLLEKNVRSNQVSNCELYHAAVSDRSGTVRFSISAADVSNSYVTTSPAVASGLFAEVEAVSLDALYLEGKIAPPDFIKIDVEGAELDVLTGSKNILTKFSPVIYLETHNLHKPGVDKACNDFLIGHGYKVEELFDQDKQPHFGAYIFKKSKT